MTLFPTEPTVDLYNEGFETSDILNRAPVGKALSDLVERIEDPMVVALDGGWGTGKTYFLKRWVGAHGRENGGNALTVYIDAFAHDYVSDPLPVLVSEIKERFGTTNQGKIKRLQTAAWKLLKPAARIGLSIATLGASEATGAFGDAVINTASGEAEKAIESYWEREEGRRTAMADFRRALEDLVASAPTAATEPATEDHAANPESLTGARLVIVIDELDRCRPDYALEMLEVVKHFFTLPGVCFVLGANLNALENSVKARYGQGIDASAYLRKFVNVTLELPKEIGERRATQPDIMIYLDDHLEKSEINAALAKDIRAHLNCVSSINHVSIRDVGKILNGFVLAQTRLLKDDTIDIGTISVAVTLVVSRVIRPELFRKFLNSSISFAELEEYFGATKLRRTERLEGKHNPEFDPYTWTQFHQWAYLVLHGKFHGEYKGERNIERRFGISGLHEHEIKTFPRDVFYYYLDLFKSTDR